MVRGLMYILTSPNSPYIKIGGTERSLRERLPGINGTVGYAEHGPWDLSDCLEVVDWQLVERRLHAHFSAHRSADIPGVRELFAIPPSEARRILRIIEPEMRIGQLSPPLPHERRGHMLDAMAWIEAPAEGPDFAAFGRDRFVQLGIEPHALA